VTPGGAPLINGKSRELKELQFTQRLVKRQWITHWLTQNIGNQQKLRKWH